MPADPRNDAPPPHRPGTIPASVWTLGLVSLFMDVSSEMIHALLPVFLVTVLGASAITVGVIEGIGEATASFAKLVSGWLSDRLGKRKALVVAGYVLAALAKPLFAVAPTAAWVLFARFADRIGKGIRGAPRDALIGDLSPSAVRGASYGLRQSLDTVGAFAGPLLAMALMGLFAGDFRLVFWCAAVPAAVAVVILVLGVREPPQPPARDRARPPLRWRELGALGPAFWGVTAAAGVLTLARFSEAFLLLRAQQMGLAAALVPLVLVVMNAVYAGCAYPLGAWSDRLGRRGLLGAGFGVLIGADLILATAPGLVQVFLGVGLWGLHMGLTQGLLAALVADTSPAAFRGTAFGIFHLVSGVALLAASVVAGVLWSWIGPASTFIVGGGFAAAGLTTLALVPRRAR